MNRNSLLLAIALIVAGSNLLLAQQPAYTSITVEKMCCDGCARKIAGKLYAVRGVKEVRVDLEKKVVFVAPQQNQALSPRALWIAVEKAEDHPIQLIGPSGTFNEKPKL